MPTPNDYSRVNFSNSPAPEEYGQVNPSDIYPAMPSELVPSPGDPERQFSSDVSGDPRDLLENTRPGIEAHADMNLAYGLTQPVATLGSHAWLRDSLADPGTSEPANAIPNQVRGVPLERTPPNK
jgi:hypothetical protein